MEIQNFINGPIFNETISNMEAKTLTLRENISKNELLRKILVLYNTLNSTE